MLALFQNLANGKALKYIQIYLIHLTLLVLGSEGCGPMAIGRHYMSLYFFSLFLVKLFTLYLTGAQKHNGRDFTLRVLWVLASSGWVQSVTDLTTALLNPRQHHRPSCAL